MKKTIKELIPLFCIVAFAFILTLGASAVAPIAGDTNGDGRVKGNDVTLMLKYLAGWDVKAEELNSDCNGDGKIKGNDATLLLKKLAGWEVELKLSREFVNFAEWSDKVVADGETDLLALLRQCISENDAIFFPKGRYLFNGTADIHSNSYILGEEGTEFICPCGTLFGGSGGEECLKNITFCDFQVTGDNYGWNFAIYVWSVRDVLVDRVEAVNTGLACIDSAGRTVEDHPRKTMNVTFRDCKGIGTTADDYSNVVASGISFNYVDGFTVSNCEFSHYNHGVYWWGDDSNYERGGRYENLGKCQNGIVENCIIGDMKLGGIWGSMGKNLIIRNNTVWNCDDVGIDFEGCDNAIAENNTVTNCYHNFASFMSTTGENIFRNNISVYTSDSPEHYYMHYNFKCDTVHAHDYQKIVMENNVFRSEGEMGLIGATYNTNPELGHFIFKNNKLENVELSSIYYSHWIDWTKDRGKFFEVWDMQVIGNEFVFNLDSHLYNYELINEKYYAPIMILVSERSSETKYPVIIKDNKIITNTPFDCGIIVEHDANENGDYDVIIEGNDISENIGAGILVIDQTNGKLNVECNNNITESITADGYLSLVNASGNVNHAGKAVSVER